MNNVNPDRKHASKKFIGAIVGAALLAGIWVRVDTMAMCERFFGGVDGDCVAEAFTDRLNGGHSEGYDDFLNTSED